jgi:aspartate aminotransferase
VGNALFVCRDEASAQATVSQALVAARRIYSMPPAHGALLAGRILASETLSASWRSELVDMCQRINGLRAGLRQKLEDKSGRDFGFIERENGMFSFLGLSTEQALRLRADYGVYMLDSSRINVAGVNARNIDYLVDAVVAVL